MYTSSPHYTVPPGYMPYNEFNTPPRTSPQPAGTHDYYNPQYYTTPPRPTTSSKRHHARTASHEPTYNFSSPRYYPSPAGYGNGTPGYYAPGPAGPVPPPEYATPKRGPTEYVSRSSHHQHKSSSSHRTKGRSYRVVYDDDEGYGTDNGRRESPRYPSDRDANRYYYDQVPAYNGEADTTPAPRRSRARRSSHSTKPAPPPKMPRAATTGPPKPAPKATEEDALRAGIPAGYSYKNWDPTEQPVMLLGSVFDANSLGKWVYDWTVYHHGPATPMSGIAGDLWLLLIQLAGKMKRADECLPRIRRRDNTEMVEDFLESGERLWIRLKRLLKACEEYMWKAAERKTAKGKTVSMGKNSGCEFVDSIFGRDRELENTEKLMTGMRLWSMRFDANCEDILRRPTA